jgi:NAD+ synthase
MAQPLTLTLAQINPIVGDVDYNRDKIIACWKNSTADLVVFPELVASGYPLEDLVLKPLFLDKIEETIKELCAASKNFGAAAIITAPLLIEGKIYNGLHLIENGRILHTQTKHHLPNYGVFDEKRVFSSGPLPSPIDFRGYRLGLLICEDLWFEDVAAHLKKQEAEILIAPHGSPFEINKHTRRLEIARARASETNLPILFVNQIGGQDELVFDGASFVMDGQGNIVLQMACFEEDIKPLSLPLRSFPLSEGRGIKGEGDPLKKIYSALSLGLKDYVIKNNFSGVLLGLSGGIDSAITAVIAADVLGSQNVHCVMLPSRFTGQESLDDAAALAQNLGCPYEIISIEEPFKALENLIDLQGLAHENSQSRLRGLILMALSNASGKMLLSTGNKSEMAVGYATLYGDMNGGFNVLKDIYKTQVYALSKWRNAQGSVIPERIITKIPTAELRENQTDQDSLPPYDVLDDILECLIEGEMSVDEILKRGHDKAVILKVWRMLDRAEYKRRQSCPGVKITTRAFGRDRRYPITNNFLKNIY